MAAPVVLTFFVRDVRTLAFFENLHVDDAEMTLRPTETNYPCTASLHGSVLEDLNIVTPNGADERVRNCLLQISGRQSVILSELCITQMVVVNLWSLGFPTLPLDSSVAEDASRTSASGRPPKRC
jgi:hypothetical protein